MKDPKVIKGFSKLSKTEKIQWVSQSYVEGDDQFTSAMKRFWLDDQELQAVFDNFSENTVSNYILPYGLAPNFLIDDTLYTVPMVIEESSVVAAAASAAKFWLERGGFKTTILNTKKVGQLHFEWTGPAELLQQYFPDLKSVILDETSPITQNMRRRGGGILDMELLSFPEEPHYYQIRMTFETCDSMGANFINSVLEESGDILKEFVGQHPVLGTQQRPVTVIMAILSNFTPECLVRAEVKCPIDQMGSVCGEMPPREFAHRFQKAIRIAEIDPYRATTHNKGIFNGIDAVVLATGNDFRAIEACGHTYAAHTGRYQSLSHCSLQGDEFHFWLDIPLAVGTVGGLTKLHPLAKSSLELLGHPSAQELMSIIAAVGLAQNFAAVRSLVTTGIQRGHMKLHLMNILQHLQATPDEKEAAASYFEDRTVSHSGVQDYLLELRNGRSNASLS
jgi:hydroxymethylglutaryl-CoA reductase